MSYTYHTIRGDWFDDGYRDNLHRGRRLEIAVQDSTLYATDDCGRPETRLTTRPDGTLAGWRANLIFAPDAGELARIGV